MIRRNLGVRRPCAALAVWTLLAGLVSAQQPQPPLAPMADQFHVVSDNIRTTLDRQTGEYVTTVDVRVFNLGGRAMETPLHLVVDTVSTNIHVTGALGGHESGPYSRFYLDASGDFPGGVVGANAMVDRELTFRYHRDEPFQYDIVPHAALIEESAPVLDLDPLTYSVEAGQALIFPVTATDPDGDPVSLFARPAVSNAVFHATNGVAAAGAFRFTPTAAQIGLHVIRFEARDTLGLTTHLDVEIEVTPSNEPPVLGEMPPRTMTAGRTLLVGIPASDTDGDPLTLEADPVPPNAVLASEVKQFLFTPDFSQTGDYTIAFAAFDGAAYSSTQHLEITVLPEPSAEPDTNDFVLVVDPVSSPTLSARQRITGFVNVGESPEAIQPSTSALITGMTPGQIQAGARTNITLQGQSSGLFESHFDNSSQALFGPGLSVDGIVSVTPHELTVTVRAAANAAPGPRGVTVVTSNETAISLVAFQVTVPQTELSGVLIDPDTGLPIVGARVVIQGTGLFTFTDGNGAFTMSGIPPGDGLLIVMGANHTLLRIPYQAVLGEAVDLGELEAAATVFNPSAPATVSLLSVLGRGSGSVTGMESLEEARRMIMDTLLLVGGDEAGVYDEFGNQLNTALGDGDGLLSFSQEGVRLLAQRVQRGGETVSLADLLFSLSFGFEWESGTPPTLAEWIELLQDVVDEAWANPNEPDHIMPIMIFNRGPRLAHTPPEISPNTQLSPLQASLFMTSFWTAQYAVLTESAWLQPDGAMPEPTGFARLRETLGWLLSPATAHADDPPDPEPDQRFTKFWRGMYQQRSDMVLGAVDNAFREYLKYTMALAGPTASLLSLTANITLAGIIGGPVFEDVAGAFGSVGLASRMPEPPPDSSFESEMGLDEGRVFVDVSFRRSSSHSYKSRGKTFIYNLWRFSDANGRRDLVDVQAWNENTPIQLPGGVFRVKDNADGSKAFFRNLRITMRDTDPLPAIPDGFGGMTQPPAKTWMYAVTVTEVSGPAADLDRDVLARTQPWWSLPLRGVDSMFTHFQGTRNELVSDYSRAVIVRVNASGTPFHVGELEVDPNRGDAYVMVRPDTGEMPRLVRVLDGGRGQRLFFANPGFASPGARGLAVDSAGKLYSGNQASEAQFGGRVFSYVPVFGNREHVGSLNYYSLQLSFANPTAIGPMAMGPGMNAARSAEDLYVVDELANVVKKVPVMAPDPALRRVGQPWADVPVQAVNFDLETDQAGSAHLLVGQVTSPLLTATLSLSDRFVSPGTLITARVAVANSGMQPIENVTVLPLTITGEGSITPVSGPEPASVDLGVGGRQTFEWVYSAASPGIARVQTIAQGTDLSGVTVGSALSPVPPLEVEVGIPLRIVEIKPEPTRVSPGSTFEVGVRVLNRGNSAFHDVTTDVIGGPAFGVAGIEGAISQVSVDPSAPQDIAPGDTADYTWTMSADAMGFVGVRAAASGEDQATMTTESTAYRLGETVTITPLAVHISAEPDAIRLNATNNVIVTLSVTNTGASAIHAVTPNLEQVLGTGVFTNSTPSSHAPVTLSAGASHQFVYTLSGPAESGAVRLEGRVTAETAGADPVPSETVEATVAIGPVIRGRIANVGFQTRTELDRQMLNRVQENIGGVTNVTVTARMRNVLGDDVVETAVTDKNGEYIIPLDAPGVYDIEATHTSGLGFTLRGVPVNLEAVTRDFQLPVALYTRVEELRKKLETIPLKVELGLSQNFFINPTNEVGYALFAEALNGFLTTRIVRGVDTPPYDGVGEEFDDWHTVMRVGAVMAFTLRRFEESEKMVDALVKALVKSTGGAAAVKKRVNNVLKVDGYTAADRKELETYFKQVKRGTMVVEYFGAEIKKAIDTYFKEVAGELTEQDKELKVAIERSIDIIVGGAGMIWQVKADGFLDKPVDAVFAMISGWMKAELMQGLFISQLTEPALMRMLDQFEGGREGGRTQLILDEINLFDQAIIKELAPKKNILDKLPTSLKDVDSAYLANLDLVFQEVTLENLAHGITTKLSDKLVSKVKPLAALKQVGVISEATIFEPGRVMLTTRFARDGDITAYRNAGPIVVLKSFALGGVE